MALNSQKLTDTLSLIAEIQCACGRTLDAHFVFHVTRPYIVEFSESTVIVSPCIWERGR